MERNLSGCASATKSARGAARRRSRPRRRRDALAGASHVFHFAARSRSPTSLIRPALDFEVNVLGTFNVLEAMRARNAGRRYFLPPPTKSTVRSPTSRCASTGERGTSPPTRACVRGRRDERRSTSQPLWLFEGAADQYFSTTRALSGSRRRLPHELHLRPPPVRHRGPGMGRALLDPARWRASRSPSTATGSRCATCSSSTTSSMRCSPRAQHRSRFGRASISAGAGEHPEPARTARAASPELGRTPAVEFLRTGAPAISATTSRISARFVATSACPANRRQRRAHSPCATGSRRRRSGAQRPSLARAPA